MSSGEEVSGEKAAPAADLNDQAVPLAYGPEPLQDPRGACVGVEAEPSVMH